MAEKTEHVDEIVDKEEIAVQEQDIIMLTVQLQELSLGDHTACKNFPRMDLASFHVLLKKVSYVICEKDTHSHTYTQ